MTCRLIWKSVVQNSKFEEDHGRARGDRRGRGRVPLSQPRAEGAWHLSIFCHRWQCGMCCSRRSSSAARQIITSAVHVVNSFMLRRCQARQRQENWILPHYSGGINQRAQGTQRRVPEAAMREARGQSGQGPKQAGPRLVHILRMHIRGRA